MVKVGLVGVEGGLALEHAAAHNAEGVENGDTKDGERERDEGEVGVVRQLAGGGESYQAHDEAGEDDAEGQRSGIADEHLGAFAEHVAKEEREERRAHDKREGDHAIVAQMGEHGAEQAAADDAVAGAIAIDAVDEVDGIDDADAGYDGEGDGDVVGNDVELPEAVEVVQLAAGKVDDVED